MKTIEERAKEYAPSPFDPDEIIYTKKGYVVNVIRDAYIVGANAQKAIDIEKACEWLKKELQELAMDEVKDNFLENDFKVILKSQVPDWLRDFRKAMEK